VGVVRRELNVELEKGIFTAFDLVPVGKEDPLPRVVAEAAGEDWLLAYPKEPALPSRESSRWRPAIPSDPDSNKWSFDSTRTRSRVTALVQVSEAGKIARIVPTGETNESLLLLWLRTTASAWSAAPGRRRKPVPSWMALDATLEYTINSARRKPNGR